MGWSDKPKAAPQSGLEMGLRLAMKMAGVDSEEVFAQVKKFAEDGSLQRIIDFADNLETHNKLLGLVYEELRQRRANVSAGTDAGSTVEPGASGGNGGPEQSAAPRLALASGANSGVS